MTYNSGVGPKEKCCRPKNGPFSTPYLCYFNLRQSASVVNAKRRLQLWHDIWRGLIEDLQCRAVARIRRIAAEGISEHQVCVVGRVLGQAEHVSELVRDQRTQALRIHRFAGTHSNQESNATGRAIGEWERGKAVARVVETRRCVRSRPTRC